MNHISMSTQPFKLPELKPSPLAGLVWPVIPDARSAGILSLLYQFEASQWLSPQELAGRQQRQLDVLLKHARAQSPYYRRLLTKPDMPLNEIPLLTRRDLQQQYEDIKAQKFPEAHGKAFEVVTAGSTGEPVRINRTQLGQLFWWASTLRDHLWHGRDFAETMAIIRFFPEPIDSERPTTWGAGVFQSGSAWRLSVNGDIRQQVEWLVKTDPHYLLTYPVNLEALLRVFETEKLRLPRLRQVRTISETLTDQLRQVCRRVLGVEVIDLYSAQEVGIIALECPESGLLHVQSENLLVEVLNDAGQACRPGEIGQVVITDLHNFAMPLIRCATNDYAEVGSECPCGRGLPTLRRVLGRKRNAALLPDGRRRWPSLSGYRFMDILPGLRQYQLIQETPQDIGVRLVINEAITLDQQKALTASIHKALDYPFTLRFECRDTALPSGPGGKFEEFISLVQ